jgi:peptide deformylase
MADKNNIVTLPHAGLRKKSTRVGIITEDVRQIIDDMEQSTLDWEGSRQHELGVALAAVQIDVHMRIVIIRSSFEDKADRTFQHFINPEITKREGNLVEDYEGCLSVKDIYGMVPRYEKVKIKAMDLDGNAVRVTAEGFLARVFQHEIDHTTGTLFIDHIKDSQESFFRLTDEGKLEKLDYEKDIRNNRILW